MVILKETGQELLSWGNYPWLTIGDTPLTFFRVLGLIIILLAVWWLAKFMERGLHRIARGQNELPSSNIYALSRLIRYGVWIIGSLLGLNYLGFNLASLALFGGAIGVGIGLGLQNIFSNFVAGIALLVEKTLKVGDFVELESGVMGRVSEIGMRYTRLTTNDLVNIIIPNNEFTSNKVTNWSYQEKTRRVHVPFGVAYGSDKEKVREAAMEAARTIEGTIEDAARPIDVWLVNFGESSLDFELVVWVNFALMMSPGRTKARYLWAIAEALAARNIEVPFPQRDLNWRSGPLEVALTKTKAD